MSELTEGYKGLLLGLSAPGVYFLMVLAGRNLKRRQGVRLGWTYRLFALGLAVYGPAKALKFSWPFLQHLGAVLVILGAEVMVALLDRFVWKQHFEQRHGVSVPKFLTEVSHILILVIALFLVLEFAYDQTIKGLLIAPGIAAVVVGLAMQDLAGNIMAGMALQTGKSFVQGDWLLIDNRHAEVIEINWRTTRLRTIDDISIEIPNREIARQTIVNLNRPHRRHAMRIPFLLEHSAPPTRTKEVLMQAVCNAQGVCPEPKPRVFVKDLAEQGVHYEIKFWMDDHALYSDVCDAICTNVWYGLNRHGLRISDAGRTLRLERPTREKRPEMPSAARNMLRQQPLFKCLTDAQLDALLPRGHVAHFGRGEKLIQQGDQGESMFILVNGEVNVLVERNGSARLVASLRSGDCFGEMSLLTGERRSATVVANTDCEVVEIAKPILARSLKEHSELLGQLSDLLARRQLENEGLLAADAQSQSVTLRQNKYAATFLDRLRAFFEL